MTAEPQDDPFAGPGPDARFHAFLAQGKFMLQRCRDNGAYVFFPRLHDPASGSTNLEWVEASGRGTVYATTVLRPRPPAAPYNVVLVDLAEGPRMMSRVDGIAPEAVTIGMAVQAAVIDEDDGPLIVFRPAAGGGND